MNERKVLFGSHNSMSYLRPNFKGFRWMFWPIIMPVYYIGVRCQNKTIDEQLEKGVRVFDLRIYSQRKDDGLYNWVFAHGMTQFNTDTKAYNIIKQLHTWSVEHNEPIYIRIILEQCKDITDEIGFIEFCSTVQKEFGDRIEFFGGNLRSTWEKIFIFDKKTLDFNDINNNQWVSSMAKDARWYEKVCPYLYAKRMNEENLKKMDYLTNLYDFL